MECILDAGLPFYISRGMDGFFYSDGKGGQKPYGLQKNNRVDKRWIILLSTYSVNPSLSKIFQIKVSTSLEKILAYAERVYTKSLRMEIKRIKEELNELKQLNTRS